MTGAGVDPNSDRVVSLLVSRADPLPTEALIYLPHQTNSGLDTSFLSVAPTHTYRDTSSLVMSAATRLRWPLRPAPSVTRLRWSSQHMSVTPTHSGHDTFRWGVMIHTVILVGDHWTNLNQLTLTSSSTLGRWILLLKRPMPPPRSACPQGPGLTRNIPRLVLHHP